jgi:hypothetical protein
MPLRQGYNENDNKPHIGPVDVLVDDIVTRATDDFISLGKRLRELAEAKPEIAMAITEMQRIDVFVQKMTHIRNAHQYAFGEAIDDSALTTMQQCYLRCLIHRLNSLQTVAATVDFSEILKALAVHLEKLFPVAGDRRNSAETYFPGSYTILEALDRLARAFTTLAHACLPPVPVDAELYHEVNTLASMYSMESERFVLRWLLENEADMDGQLCEAYRHAHWMPQEAEAECEIELF